MIKVLNHSPKVQVDVTPFGAVVLTAREPVMIYTEQDDEDEMLVWVSVSPKPEFNMKPGDKRVLKDLPDGFLVAIHHERVLPEA